MWCLSVSTFLLSKIRKVSIVTTPIVGKFWGQQQGKTTKKWLLDLSDEAENIVYEGIGKCQQTNIGKILKCLIGDK